jgi:aldose 1-epimerase
MKKNAMTVLVLLGSVFLNHGWKANAADLKESKNVTKQVFGKLADGRDVFLYTLQNSQGMKVSISTLGATVTSLWAPDRNGKPADVVLGYDTPEEYRQGGSYFGAIVGRYGNRIGKGRFKLDGQEYQLAINDGLNHLHGGKIGFDKLLWEAQETAGDSFSALALTLVSPDGDQGYPGTVKLTVTYTLTEKNELRIEYRGTTDKATILNPTHHSYFNLSGSFTSTILDHLLTMDADFITPVDKGLIPTGQLLDVTGTPMDFRKPTAIGARINDASEQLAFGRGYDHNWVLNRHDGKVRKVAELYDPKSGRLMTLYTDQPGLQFYSGNFLDGRARGKGVAFQYRTGLCLETQCFPDSPNHPAFPTATLRPGAVYRQTTIYQFSTR